jgi:hypothetical protein
MRKIILLTCLFLTGCANLDEEARSDDEQCAFHGSGRDSTHYLQCRNQLAAARVPLKPGQIRCLVGADCDAKWARVDRWVTENLGLKIQSKTDALIKTAQSTQDSRALVVTITKNHTPQPGVYEIDFTGGCPSIFSCVPSVSETRSIFTELFRTAE